MSKGTGHDVSTACPLDCPDSCSLSVSLSDGRVVALDGSHANPVTAGYICGKVRRFAERMYGPDRLLRPGFRLGPPGSGEFRWVSWDEALGRVAEAMREARDRWGAESVLPYCYGGSNRLNSRASVVSCVSRPFEPP
jgi:anaerobic selenocysteine-containing dehydrogenase